MDVGQQNGRRLYRAAAGWVYNPCEALPSLHPDRARNYFFNMVDAGCQVALVLVEYSRQNGRVTVHQIKLLQKAVLNEP
jgi:hypothetical protein